MTTRLRAGLPTSNGEILGLTWPGFFIGLVESFLYGAYFGMVYVPIYNFFKRRWDTGQ